METKSGLKTTEFWFGVVAFAIGALMASGLFDGNAWVQMAGAIGMSLSSGAYAVGRGLAKQGIKPDESK